VDQRDRPREVVLVARIHPRLQEVVLAAVLRRVAIDDGLVDRVVDDHLQLVRR
jgi:hypothetical protein